MSTFWEKINILESRLQVLIEGGTARVFSGGDQQTNFFSGIMASMQSGIKTFETGKTLAPDIFILFAHPETAELIHGKQDLMEALNELVEQVGIDSGYKFLNKPKIKISADTSKVPGEIEILHQFSLAELDETSTIGKDYSETQSAPKNAYLILGGNQIIQLTQPVVNIGRRIDNQIVLEDPSISRLHAQIRAIDNRYMIFDLDSSGGTYVNNVRINQTRLYPGDVISLAGVDLVFGQDEVYLDTDAQGSTQPLLPNP
jgi:hypothetical protein